ncbi:unnamed protein product [Adineta steineri]|uniref:Uncharacterized protein n=1 Tax=Adineta steineri TaxID=433720 RepID=A0A815BQS2_9BILA|nr:unnamed protein product [Adineta steineri]CAF1293979.1 unnamed protein product [Adineta steineri]
MLRIKQDSQIVIQRSEVQQYVPLKSVNIEATIRSFAADVTITQVFRNDEKTSIEAVYCFPIEEQAAIYAFVAHIDDREIIAQLKEKKKAQQEYTEALQQGHGAYLLEQDEKSQDNFIINVGALPPGKECKITISYVSELNLVENGTKIRFVVPTTIAPRYNPDKGGLSSPAVTTSKYVQKSPYTIKFQCQIEKVGVARVSSASHPIQVDFRNQDAYVITFAQDNTQLDRDILVDIELSKNRLNTIVAVESGAVMASFIPSEEDCQKVMNNVETMNEFIFIVDCSGSMADEGKIGLARQALLLFLKSLPVNCQFNIVRFGSTHQTLFNDITTVYDEKNAEKAEGLINRMKADLGGTELLSPLQWLEANPPAQGHARQIFLLTDGEISNVDQVLDLCRSMATSSRIFSFGLGHSPSRSLVKGLARATNGRFVFIPPNTSADVHVGEQLQKALQSCITDVQVKWNLGTTALLNVPTKTPPVYVNDRLIVYALIEDKSHKFDHNSSVELKTEQHRLGEANITQIPVTSNNATIARLAAKALILELQHSKLPPSINKGNVGSRQTRFQQPVVSKDESATTKETTQKRIIDLSLKYNILSPHTAFVGVEKRVNANNSDMVLREVPIQISADDQHLGIHSSVRFARSASTAHCFAAMSPTMMCDSYSEDDDDCDDCFSPQAVHASSSITEQIVRKGACQTDSEDSDDDMDEPWAVHASSSITNEKAKEDAWPTDNQDIVRYLVSKQKFNGSWDFDSKSIEKLTGKPLSDFQQSTNNQILVSAIVITVLETRFAALSSIWHGIVQKARKRLIDLLGKDSKALESLLEDIRKNL